MSVGKEVILNDNAFLVSETDEKGIIRFANDDFCSIAEYKLDELIGQPHNIVRHPDMPKAAFKSLWETVKSDGIWTGFVKNKTSSNRFYWVYATVYSFESADGKKGYLSCRRKPTKNEIQKYEKLYEGWKLQE